MKIDLHDPIPTGQRDPRHHRTCEMFPKKPAKRRALPGLSYLRGQMQPAQALLHRKNQISHPAHVEGRRTGTELIGLPDSLADERLSKLGDQDV